MISCSMILLFCPPGRMQKNFPGYFMSPRSFLLSKKNRSLFFAENSCTKIEKNINFAAAFETSFS
jgi:hypothetical protein